MPESDAASATRFPVSVLMERRVARSGPWSEYQWDCLAVVSGERMTDAAAGRTLVGEEGERARYVWSGLRIALHKDACESYWFNLQSETPYLFVICYRDEAAEDESLAVEPALVTASQDEANAHLESEDLVYSVPMPDAVIAWLERFVVDHYEPEIKKKRKRRNWAQEGERNARGGRPEDRLH
jgi:hypothetical protein